MRTRHLHSGTFEAAREAAGEAAEQARRRTVHHLFNTRLAAARPGRKAGPAPRPGGRQGHAPHEQLDFPGFVERCKSAVTAFQHQIVKKRRQKDDQKRRQARKAVSCPTWSQRPAAGCEG